MYELSTQDQFSEDQEMNMMGHLGELRNRLVWSAIIFIIFFIAGFVFVKDIYMFFTNDLDFTLNVISPGEIIWVYLIIASVIAIAGTLPFLCIQVWLFVRPALTPKERKVTLTYIPGIFLLFLGGLFFGYFVIRPLIFDFLVSLSTDMVEIMFTADKYFRFLLQVTFPFAILFEIPVISMFLTSLGIINPSLLRKIRKYAYLVLIIIGTMISPPDFLLQMIVAIPLIVLYEISIFMSRLVYRKKQAAQEEVEEE